MFVNGLTKAFKIEYVAQGFVQMLLLDANHFDRQHYDFQFVRREFLGDIRTDLFDVTPKPGSGTGRFIGRVWIEDTGGNIVRFSGTYTSRNGREVYYHFDSWRTNVQPGLWLPTAVYAEEHGPGIVADQAGFFRAQTWIWGYSLRQPASSSTNATVQIDAVPTPARAPRMSALCRLPACGPSRPNKTFSTACFKLDFWRARAALTRSWNRSPTT